MLVLFYILDIDCYSSHNLSKFNYNFTLMIAAMGGWKRRATPSCALLRGTSTGFGAGACCAGGGETRGRRRCAGGAHRATKEWITKNQANLINGSYIKIST